MGVLSVLRRVTCSKPKATGRRAATICAVELLEERVLLTACLPTGKAVDALASCRNWISYAPSQPYNPNVGLFPTEQDIRDDLTQLHSEGWRGLVTYSLDNVLQEVPRIAKEVGFTSVIAGAFWFDDAQLVREKTAALEELTYIDAFVVGNEGIHRSSYTYEQLTVEVTWFQQNTGKPVTTTETTEQYFVDNRLLDLGDWVFPNIQPWHNPGTDPTNTASMVDTVKGEYVGLTNIQPDRTIVFKEVWWPTDGPDPGTEAKQAAFFAQLSQQPVKFVWGEAYDQPWKNEGERLGTSLGPNWGLHQSDGTPKQIIDALSDVYSSSYPQSSEIGVRRSDTFYLDVNGNGGWNPGIDRVIPFGFASDTPVIGDWNGDGIDEIGVRRADTFYLDQNGNGGWDSGIDRVIPFGFASDTPVIGDWDGDGTDEIGVRRGDTFYLDFNGSGGWNPGIDLVIPFGFASDTPVIGDWNGDGADEIGVRRGDTFLLDVNGNGGWNPGIDRSNPFGFASDTPVIGDWNGDGKDDIGVRRNEFFYLDQNGSGGWNSGIDRVIPFGLPSDTPLSGNWANNGGPTKTGPGKTDASAPLEVAIPRVVSVNSDSGSVDETPPLVVESAGKSAVAQSTGNPYHVATYDELIDDLESATRQRSTDVQAVDQLFSSIDDLDSGV